MNDKKTEKTKVPMSKKKKIILKVLLVLVALVVVWRVNAMINTKHAVVPDGGVAMHDYLESLGDKN